MKIFQIIRFKKKLEEKEENKLKIEHILTIFTILGSIFYFLFINRETILQYFFPTTISMSTKSKFHYNHAKVHLTSKDINLTIPLKEMEEGIKVNQGNYNINITLYDKKIWEEKNIYIKNNIETNIQIRLNDSIIIKTSMFPATPTRGESFDLQVESSGTGCLWIYDIADHDYNKIYPTNENCLKIIAGEKLYLNKKINASKNKHKDFIIFLVTASRKYSDAESIMQMYSSKRTFKATFNQSKLNWGIKELKYNIK